MMLTSPPVLPSDQSVVFNNLASNQHGCMIHNELALLCGTKNCRLTFSPPLDVAPLMSCISTYPSGLRVPDIFI